MEQFEITEAGNLLDESGRVRQPGYAKDLILSYNRDMVKASRLRIKEWDYYFIGNQEFGLSVTVADNSYMGLVGATFFQYGQQKKLHYAKMIPFPLGKMKLPSDSRTGDISHQSKGVSIKIETYDSHKELYCNISNFDGDAPLELKVMLFYRNDDSMVIATPFKEDEKAFYYNQKVNNLEAEGILTIGDEEYKLHKMMGVLDWGRGVWTYDNTWYWSSASARLEDGSLFGFNLGYGFGDTSKATENIVFYKGKGYKLQDVDFGLPSSGYLDEWHFTSRDGAINMKFKPIYDNRTKINYGFLGQDAHQVFGLFSGFIQIEEKKIEVNEVFGFAEKVRNKW